GDEYAPEAVLAGDHDAQVPEPDVVEVRVEVKAGRVVEQAKEVEVVGCRVARHGRVKEKAFADVDPTEELPVAVELRLHHPVRGGGWESVEKFVQFLRAEHRQHHALLEVPPAAIDAHALAHQRLATVASD